MNSAALAACLEHLESRMMLAASPDGLTPAQVRHAYEFDQVSFPARHGTRISGDGRGQTIAIVVAYRTPNIINDFKVFNQTFGLPQTDLSGAPILTQVTLKTSRGRVPRVDSGWAGEAS